MNTTIKTVRNIVGITAVAAGTSFGPAFADNPGQDWKGYAGINCLSSNDSANVRRSSVGQVGFSNNGTGTLTVFCPVVRDVPEASDVRVTRVRVHFRNRNEKVDGSCEFSSRDSLGMIVDAKSVVAPFGEHTLTIDGPLKAEAWGSYVLACQLPGIDADTGLPSYIVNYRVDEKL